MSSRYGDLKRGPDGRVIPEDLACWRDLVDAAAMAAIGEPASPIPGLAKVSKIARNACAPRVVTRENPCVRLSNLAVRYVNETTAGRRSLQGELAETADKAREQLEEHDKPCGAERKDIHG
jgi:hypothetical protein